MNRHHRQLSRAPILKHVALLGSLIASVALATTLLAADVPALSRSADVILIGKVESSTPRLTQEGHRIMTDTLITVSEVLKGAAGPSVLVMQPGGIVGDLGQHVEGAAPFAAGEEVLVFLDRRGNSEHFAVTAMVQGKYRLERSSQGAVTAVPQSESAARLIDPLTRQETSSALKRVQLPILKAQIAAALAGPLPVEPTGPLAPKVGR